MVEFLNVCLQKAGADSMITPREMLRDYMTVLNILMQNPEAEFATVVGKTAVAHGDSNDSDETETEPSKAKNKAEDILDVLEF